MFNVTLNDTYQSKRMELNKTIKQENETESDAYQSIQYSPKKTQNHTETDTYLSFKNSPKKPKIEKLDMEKDEYQRYNVSPKKDRLEKAHFDLKNKLFN